MRVLLHSDTALSVGAFDAPGLHVSAAPDTDAHYSAFQMFAVSIGLCTASLLMAYAEQLEASAEGLSVRLEWTVAESPRRIDALDMQVSWPGLPASRLRAARLVADQCPLHRTLEHSPRLSTHITREAAPPLHASGASPHGHAQHEHHSH